MKTNQLLVLFLHKQRDLSSSGLQIDSEGHLYASGEMIAAWQNDVLFIDFGSSKVYNRRAANDLKELTEKEGIKYVLYNTHSYPISPDFCFVERMVSYPIWATPSEVNPKNIFAQSKKLLDKAVEKNISSKSINDLVDSIQHIASLFNFEFDATQYETKRQQQEQLERAKKQQAAQYHLREYTRLQKELETT